MEHRLFRNVEENVISILSELCKKEGSEIHRAQSLANDLEVDSIQFLELLSLLEERFGIEMEVEDLHPEQFRSVQSVIHFVLGKIAS